MPLSLRHSPAGRGHLTDGASETAGSESKARVFISYARTDSDFADRLVAALKERGFETFIDRGDIAPGEDWSSRLKELITTADNVVFVLESEALNSKSCIREIAFAASLNKRFAPVVLRRVSASRVPEPLQKPQWTFFDDPQRFGERLDELVKALETDMDWIRKHAEFTRHAQRWDEAKRPGAEGLLLRPPLLNEAENLIAWPPRGVPDPELLREYLAVSRQAYQQEQAAIASSQVNLLAQVAEAEQLRGNMNTAIKLGVHAARKGLDLQNRSSAPSLAAATLTVISQNWCRVLLSHETGLRKASFSPDGLHIITALDDNTARIWNAVSGKEVAVLRGHQGIVWSVDFSPNSSLVITGSADKTARVWDVAAAKEIAVLNGHTGAVLCATFGSGGRHIITGSEDRTARIWDTATGQEIAILREFSNSVWAAVLSPDDAQIVTAQYDDTARLWDAVSAEEIAVLRGHQHTVWTAAFSPDGRRIVTASSDKTARIWDTVTANEIAVLRGHEKAVMSATFSPDGSRIATASSDNTARIWDAAVGNELMVLRGHRNQVCSATFDFKGSRVLDGVNRSDRSGLGYGASHGGHGVSRTRGQRCVGCV